MSMGFVSSRSRQALVWVLALGLVAASGTISLAQEAAPQAETAPATVAPVEPAAPSPSAPAVDQPAPSSEPAPAASAPQGDAIPGSAPVEQSFPTETAPLVPDTASSEVAARAGAEETGVNATLPHDLSPWGMYLAADIVVKAVMIGLAFASFITWTVAVAKLIEIACARARASKARERIFEAESLEAAAEALSGRGGPAAFMVRTAKAELERSDAALDRAGTSGLKERVASYLSDIEARAGRRLNTGTGILATIGSTAPFVGLFGTVWGIMNSFIGISKAQTTNLAIVAPGIAEALLATAIGLVAAIPAVIIYNVFARQIAGYRHLLREAGSGVERLVSRDVDYRMAGGRRAEPRSVAAE